MPSSAGAASGAGAATISTALDVLVVEDEPLIAKMLKLNLEHAGLKARCVGSVAQAQEAIDEQLPDVILLDWMLPDAPGIRLAEALRRDEAARHVFILMLTARASEEDTLRGFASGVDDYITKPFSPRELVARIKAVGRRVAATPPPPKLSALGLTLDSQARTLVLDEATGADGIITTQEVRLTPTELRLMQFFLGNVSRVLSREQILRKVWPEQDAVDTRTVDVHVMRLREALRQLGKHKLLQTVRGTGYQLR